MFMTRLITLLFMLAFSAQVFAKPYCNWKYSYCIDIPHPVEKIEEPDANDKIRITYELLKNDSHIVSGYMTNTDNIFYRYTKIIQGTEYVISFIYPKIHKKKMNSIIKNTVASLRVD